MLDPETKRRIDTARDILVGKIPDPKSQVEQITIALVYKFMDDMDEDSRELGGKATFFKGEFQKYSWHKIFDPKMSGIEMVNAYGEAIQKMNQNSNIPQLFRDIFKNAYLPYRDPETLKSFLKVIGEFEYTHSERLGDAFEYLLSVLGSQGEAGQFRTPRHIIDFMVEIIDPKKSESVLDPACGTAGFLISSYKHILKHNSKNFNPEKDRKAFEIHDVNLEEITINNKEYKGDELSSDDKERLVKNIKGYDISPDMVRLSLVNMYLHEFKNPKIVEYDTLTSEDKWGEYADVILANPPFMSPKGGIKPHKKFSISSNRSEVLFVDYIAEHLSSQGRSCVIVPEGIIFQSQTAHTNLRKMLIEKNYLVGVISLPAGLFNPYSGVKTSILWLDKALAKKTDKILFVKIENDGFNLGAQRRPIKDNNLPESFRAIRAYKEAVADGKKFNADKWQNILVVDKIKIAENEDYDLTGERYKISAPTRLHKWPMVELSSVVELVRGVTYTKNDEVGNGGHKVLRANNISLNGDLVLDDVKQISIKLGFKEKQKLKSKDIFICLASGSKDHIGKVTYIDKATDYYFGSFMGVVRTINETIDPLYVFYLLRSYKFNEYLRQTISGANINNLNSAILGNYKIPLPPISVQEEIIAEVGRYQKIVDGARQVIENYRPHIDLDPDWPVVEISELPLELKSGFAFGGSDKISTGIPHIRPMNITSSGDFTLEGSKFIPENVFNAHRDYNLLKGDVLFNNTNSKELVGKTCYISKDIKCGYSNHMTRIRAKSSSINTHFIAVYLHILWTKTYFLSKCHKWIGQAGIGLKELSSTQIRMPSRIIQDKIVASIVGEQKLINSCKETVAAFQQKIANCVAQVWGEK